MAKTIEGGGAKICYLLEHLYLKLEKYQAYGVFVKDGGASTVAPPRLRETRLLPPWRPSSLLSLPAE